MRAAILASDHPLVVELGGVLDLFFGQSVAAHHCTVAVESRADSAMFDVELSAQLVMVDPAV